MNVVSSKCLRSVLLACLFSGLPLSACGADGGNGDSLQQTPSFVVGNVQYTRRCSTLAFDGCQRRCEECRDECELQQASDESIDCDVECRSRCACTEPEPWECDYYVYSFDFGAPSDAVWQACIDELYEYRETCDWVLHRYQCSQFAKVEESIEKFDCASENAREGNCDNRWQGCTPLSDLGTRLCNKWDRCGYECPLNVALVNRGGHWLRDDVKQAAFKCLDFRDCAEAHGCLSTWQASVQDAIKKPY